MSEWTKSETAWRHCEPIFRKILELREPLRINYPNPEYLACKIRAALLSQKRHHWATDIDVKALVGLNIGIAKSKDHIIIGPKRKMEIRHQCPRITQRRLRCDPEEADALCRLMTGRVLQGTWVFQDLKPEVIARLQERWPMLVWEPLDDGSIAIT